VPPIPPADDDGLSELVVVPYKSSLLSSSSLSPTAKGSRSSAGRRGSHFLLGEGPPTD